MGDNSPKNQHKLDEQKHEEHVKDYEKLENAARQHHPDRPLTPEKTVALNRKETAADAASAVTAE